MRWGLLLVLAFVEGVAYGQSTLPQDSAAQASLKSRGEAVYKQQCAACHEAGVSRAAPLSALAAMSAENIRFALTAGVMSVQGGNLAAADREAVVAFLAKSPSKPAASIADAACAARRKPYEASFRQPHWNGWGVNLAQHRFQPAAQARLRPEQVPKLKLQWSFGFPGASAANSQPTIVNGRLFVGSANRQMYALDAVTGCTYWVYDTEAAVRNAPTVAVIGKRALVYFGDRRGTAYALDADNGKLQWKVRLDDHPVASITGSPVLAGGVLYVPMASAEDSTGADPRYECCKFRGSMSALDPATGKVLWKSFTIDEPLRPTSKNALGTQLWGPAGAGIWSAPAIDLQRGRLYATTSNNTTDPPTNTSDAFVAFDLQTGKLLWSRQGTAGDVYNIACDLPPKFAVNCPWEGGQDFDFGASPMLVDLKGGRRALIAGQKSGVVHAIDPDQQGKVIWQKALSSGGVLGGIQWGTATDGKTVYVALSDAKLETVPKGTPGAQDMYLSSVKFNPKVGGGLYALDAATGEIRWHTPHPGCSDRPGCSPAQSAAVTAIAGTVFSGGLDGHLRAYASGDGRIVWDFDTIRDYTTVNGVPGRGGSVNGPGAVVVDGMVYVNSGHVHIGTTAGNVLLAFAVED